MDDLVGDFVCEAAEVLGGLQAGVARLAADGSDFAAAQEMLRRLHALKGLCGFVAFHRAEALIHAGESLSATLTVAPASTVVVSGLSRMVERLGVLFAFAAEHHVEPDGDDAELIAGLEGAAVQLVHAEPARAAAVVALSPSHLSWPEIERRARAPWLGLDALARTLGDRLGKRIELVIGGDDLRIAPQASRSLRLALIALVRNACDHGVEDPAMRRAAGKPARSLLRLSVHRAGDGAVIELADDGRGVDPDQIRARFVAEGRLSPDAVAALDDQTAQDLIFVSGFSTAATVGPLSGRGLGLEMTKAEVDALGGTIELASIPNQGARFVITLPASAIASAAARGRQAA